MKPLKRHPDLIERSREHHHSLALCLRILRHPAGCHRADIETHLPDLLAHFAAEEHQFAPHWHNIAPALRARFESDHRQLREMAAAPQYGSEAWNTGFALTLRNHARFEERELFPALEPFL
ncbi:MULTISPECIES: hemerythrin domain-containing protein [unclassified Neisseria]|uniref:hemerythrin domain-containing protein n=1 Tax=unclassified Neisseria TaxID=2623750 RepID=UPI001071A49C|nr:MULTISPECIES: hemerythrin domain-containing protein [unclassified Neisseria]MBF0804168.1 hemerythrin domain-containing protein [Neisseria sp. 19428wB4_WF04]TFU43092.1 hemerythrin domain-containing protein [Neisseria sp. WF04]